MEDKFYCRPLGKLGRAGTANHWNFRKFFTSFSLFTARDYNLCWLFLKKKFYYSFSFVLNISYFLRKQWHRTPVLLPGKSHGRRAWWAVVHGVTKSWTRLSDFTFTFHFHTLEKEMATHSGVLAWRIPGTGEPGGLPSMGSHRVGHNWSDSAAVLVKYFKKQLVLN